MNDSRVYNAARLAAVVAGMLFLCATLVSGANAEFVEYYNYVVDEEGDTTVVVVAAFDTTAMELKGEIRQSPLGSSVKTSPLVDHGGGFLTGSIVVSVTDGGSQFITLKSHILFLPLFGPTHMDTLDADFDMPIMRGRALTGSATSNEYIDLDFEVKTTYNSQTGEKETSAQVTASAAIDAKTTISLTDNTMVKESGTTQETYLKVDLALEDGSTNAALEAKHTEDEHGKKTAAVKGSVTNSGRNTEIEFGVGVKTDDGGTTTTVDGTYKQTLAETLGYHFDLLVEATGSRVTTTAGLTLEWRPWSWMEIFFGIYYNSAEAHMNGTCGYRGYFLDPKSQKDRPTISLSSPYNTDFYGTMQSTYCCPDTTACADQPALEEEIPAGNCLSCDLDYYCSFDPSDPNSFTESLSLQLTRAPRPSIKKRFRELPTTEGIEPAYQNPPVGRYISTSPNPFNADTRITFETAAEEMVDVQIYDVRGRRIRALASRVYPPGRNHVMWDGRNDEGELVAGGMYFVALRGKGWYATGRALLLK